MARGPKAFGAVRAAGLEHLRTTVHESTEGVVDELAGSGDAYRCVALQCTATPTRPSSRGWPASRARC